jgi:lipopolysaccharide export LptBFGC system permease protein LptF
MKLFPVFIVIFVIALPIVSYVINKKRSWKNFKLLDEEKLELEEDGVKVNFSAPPKNTFLKSNVKITNKRIIILVKPLLSKQETVLWVFDFLASTGSSLRNSLSGHYFVDKSDVRVEKNSDGKEYIYAEGKMSEKTYNFKLKLFLTNVEKAKKLLISGV